MRARPREINIFNMSLLDILCGAWFFYLLRKGLEVYGFAMGWRDLGWDAAGFPFTRAQAAGAWAAMLAATVVSP